MKVLLPLTGAVLLLIILTSISWAEDVYVQSIKASILSEPVTGSKIVATVKRGEILHVIEKKAMWFMVSYRDVKGWVSKLVVDQKPPSGKISIIEKTGERLEEGARKRASAFVTAAAARGLMEERARLSDKYRVDHKGIEWLEKIDVSEEDALRYIEEGLKQ